MNPTFSSPVLTERCSYRWEDLEKAAQGVYTDELKAEQERLRSDFELQKAATGFAVEGFINARSGATVAASTPAAFTAEPMPEAAPVQKASSGFTVPFRDESGFRVKESDDRAQRRTFFEPPRVTIPTRQQPVAAMRPQPVAAAEAPAAADPALLERVAQEAASAVTASLLGQIDIIIAMAMKSASAKIKSDVEAALSSAAQQGVRDTLSRIQTTSL